MTRTLEQLLGVTPEKSEQVLADLVQEAFDVQVDGPALVGVVDYAFDSPATGGLYRVSGRTTDGEGWSLFCKLIQHVRHWPKIHFLPEEIRADFAEQLPWRSELQLWDPAQLASFPDGLRAPALYRIIDLGDDRLSVWQEDVAHDHGTWDLDRFRRAAYLLGRWNARSTGPEALGVVDDLAPGYALRMYALNAVSHRGLGPLGSDELWSHPWLAGHADLRADLLSLGARIPELLEMLDGFTQCAPHGDASPQNLLCPPEDPDTLVAIDLSFRSSHALGFDLGQLVVGLVHADLMPAADLPGVATVVLAAYTEGLNAEGIGDRDDEAARGFATSVLLRSAFDSFLYDLLEDGSDEARRRFDERVALSRFLVEQFHALVD